jgi:hypothetical protein
MMSDILRDLSVFRIAFAIYSTPLHLAITTATIATTPASITTTKHPPGLGNPFRISRTVSDS